MICTAYFWLDGGRLNPTQFKRQSQECFAIFLTPARPLTNSLEKLFFFLLLFSNSIKGIVSRDWEGLQMIWLQRLEVFNISAECFFYRCFHIEFLKMAAWAVLHFNIAHQRTSTSPGTQTVLRTAKKSCRECSPEIPGKLIRQISIFNFFSFQLKRWISTC